MLATVGKGQNTAGAFLGSKFLDSETVQINVLRRSRRPLAERASTAPEVESGFKTTLLCLH
jgi:hypothetical protein